MWNQKQSNLIINILYGLWCLWSKHAAPEMQTLHKWLGKAIETPGTLEAAKKSTNKPKQFQLYFVCCSNAASRVPGAVAWKSHSCMQQQAFPSLLLFLCFFSPCFTCTVYSVQSACTGCVFEDVAGKTPATPKTKK